MEGCVIWGSFPILSHDPSFQQKKTQKIVENQGESTPRCVAPGGGGGKAGLIQSADLVREGWLSPVWGKSVEETICRGPSDFQSSRNTDPLVATCCLKPASQRGQKPDATALGLPPPLPFEQKSDGHRGGPEIWPWLKSPVSPQ